MINDSLLLQIGGSTVPTLDGPRYPAQTTVDSCWDTTAKTDRLRLHKRMSNIL